MRNARRLVVASSVVVVLAAVGVGTVSGADASRAHELDKSFSGSGSKDLAPFRVNAPSTLFWAAQGGLFGLIDNGLGGGVTSQAAAGWSYLKPGTYQYSVSAVGSWRIRVTAGRVPPKSLGAGRVGYTGSGSLELPPVRFNRNKTLSWTARGGLFGLIDSNFLGGANVTSQASRGSTFVRAGTHEWSVSGVGAWRISWPR